MERVFLERRDSGDDVRRCLEWLETGDAAAGLVAPFSPPMDVVETSGEVEIVQDIPGVRVDGIRVTFSSGLLVITGRKLAPVRERAETTFHLAERSFGRFVSVVRLAGAFDAGRAHAILQAGELRIVLPRIEERRGGEIRIAVDTA